VINLREKGQGLKSEELLVTTPAHGEENNYLYIDTNANPGNFGCNNKCHVKFTGRTP
jgi:hypothetical protein